MKFSQVIFHQSWDGSGFCYKRINQLLNKTEFIAYAGYFGAWTDNPSYYERALIKNTLLHRNALVLKHVNWLSFYTQYDKIPINRKDPFYNVYIYHGT